MISLSAFGGFRVTGEHGEDLTPKGLKARGLIALLALAPDHCRSREWLQDKLWSDRSQKQGADSLRQSLMDIRRAFGEQAGILTAGREKVRLDSRGFVVNFDRPFGRGADKCDIELFGDLDIPDAEFEEWIRNERLTFSPPLRGDANETHVQRRLDNPVIFLRCDGTGTSEGQAIVKSVLSLVTASLLDFSDFQIFQDFDCATPIRREPPRRGLVVSARMPPGQQWLSITILHPSRGQIFWTRSVRVPMFFNDELMHPVCSEIVEAVLRTFRTRSDDLEIPDCAAMMANRGRNLIFQFDKHRLLQADAHLRLAYEYDPRPQYLAWRSYLRIVAQFQHRSSHFLGGDATDTMMLAREAIQEAPSSAIALGVAAHIEYLFGGSVKSSLQLATHAVALDPLNAITHAILSNTELIIDNRPDSQRSASMALALAGGSECRALIEFFCCMSATALGEYEIATHHAEMAAILRPSFMDPLRYLVALYNHAGRTDELTRTITRIQSAEPDFHMARLLDNDYPNTTLRRMRLMEAIAR
ncbi:hypothetical protein HGP14_08825 [Rhizobium sp. P32RR-XVIII]|nr:hypothetical protein [Rhizobium sp. P32RR-XVIII]